jgi:hypothetical protein
MPYSVDLTVLLFSTPVLKSEIDVFKYVPMMFKSYVQPTIKINIYNVSITTIIEYITLENDPCV